MRQDPAKQRQAAHAARKAKGRRLHAMTCCRASAKRMRRDFRLKFPQTARMWDDAGKALAAVALLSARRS